MGAMRKMAVYLGLVEDEELEYADHDEYADARSSRREPAPYSSVREVRPEPRPVARTPEPARATSRTAVAETAAIPRVDVPPVDAFGAGDLYRITTLHPRTYNDARRIGEEFRAGVPVIMNLTEMDDTDAKRIVDFAAGLVFGCHGTIERVTNKVFLLSPANVDVAAEAKRLAQDGFFNQS